ncbi:MAG TPA: alpha/beta fold hydrolase [Thermoanaerobaculia bacterium]
MSATDPAVELIRTMRAMLNASGLAREQFSGSVYWVGGKGTEALVLLHGTNDQAGTWARVAPLLAGKYRLIIPDLAGHGDSDPKSGPIPFSLVVDQLHRVLDREHADNIVLAGNSFGAWIAILYTLAHPGRVKRLVLESGGGLARPLAVPLTAGDRATAMTILRAVHGPNYVPQDWVIDSLLLRSSDSPMLRLTGAMQSFVDSRLSLISAPTTLVWGADDGVLPLAYAEALQKGIAGAKLSVINAAAHVPHLQQPERFVECLMATS